jgi:hypothetical protein
MRNCSVTVHSCEKLGLLHDRINAVNPDGNPAYQEYEKFFLLREYEKNTKPCKCKRLVTKEEAQILVATGEAHWHLLPANGFGEEKMRVWESNQSVVLKMAIRTPRASSGGEKAQTERQAEGSKDDRETIEEGHAITLGFRALLYRGIVLENGKYLSGEPIRWSHHDDPFYDRAILIFFGLDERTNYGRQQ